jgi:glutamate:GABA antiporter
MTKKRSLTVFSLTMLNIASILSIRNWPFMVEYGFSSICYILLAALVFFIPVSLVSAELATAMPEKGGILVWVEKAFGKKAGILAIWLVWISNAVWYPTLLAFISSTILHCVSPSLAMHPLMNFLLVFAIFWIAVFVNLFGLKFTSAWSTFAVICGTFLPGLLIIGLGTFWYFHQGTSHIEISTAAFWPKISGLGEIVFFVGLLLGFAGMEMNAIHANDVENPQKNFPKAIFFSGFIILTLSILGTLAIGVVIPREQVSLVSGVIQTLEGYLVRYNLGFLTPLVGLSVAIGALGGVVTWLVGPSRGLLEALKTLNAPRFLQMENKHGMPQGIMIFQAVLVTLLSFVFLLMPSVGSGFWVLTALACQLYLIAYIMMFAAAIVLRLRAPKMERPYKVPGGKIGLLLVSGVGVVGALISIAIGFLPPDQLNMGNIFYYEFFLLLALFVFLSFPYWFSEKKQVVLTKS